MPDAGGAGEARGCGGVGGYAPIVARLLGAVLGAVVAHGDAEKLSKVM